MSHGPPGPSGAGERGSPGEGKQTPPSQPALPPLSPRPSSRCNHQRLGAALQEGPGGAVHALRMRGGSAIHSIHLPALCSRVPGTRVPCQHAAASSGPSKGASPAKPEVTVPPKAPGHLGCRAGWSVPSQ